LATGVSGVDLVPILDFGFPELPTEKNFSAFPQSREIDESAIEVLQLTSGGVDFGGKSSNVADHPKVLGVYRHAALSLDILGGESAIVVGFLQLLASGAELAQSFREKRNELVGLFDGEKTFLHASGSLAKTDESTKKKQTL
jgi:hypothetical protein